MKVLMLSGDRNILREGSDAYKRFALQRAAVERLDVFVWPQVHSRGEFFCAAARGGYDVVTSQDPFWRGLLAWRAAHLGGVKLNVQVHTDLSAQSFVRRVLARFVLRRADSIRVVSEKIKQHVLHINGNARVQVLPVFVDVAPFANLPHQPYPKFKKTILWYGRFEPEKDPARAIAIAQSVRGAGMDAGLILLGTGSLEGELKHQAKNLPWVEFAPWGDPKPYLQMADLVLSTSRHESWGASIVEALAAGVPVVAPDVGIAKEAGAIVAGRSELADAAIEVLRSGAHGELKLRLPIAQEWVAQWRHGIAS